MSGAADQPRAGKLIVTPLHGAHANGHVGDSVREILGEKIEAHNDLAANKAKYQAKYDRLMAAWKSLADCYETRDPDAITAANEAINCAIDDLYDLDTTGDPGADRAIKAELSREFYEEFQQQIENGEWPLGDPTTPEGREERRQFFVMAHRWNALSALTVKDQTFEIRAVYGPRDARSRICHSLYDGVNAAEKFKDAKGVYFTLNPLPADLKRAAKDEDVIIRHLLLIDLDATRSEKGELSATNEEKQAVIDLCPVVIKWLDIRGWPRPIVIDSGNGIHLLFWIDLPNDTASHDLLKAVLTRLAKRFNTLGAKVDTTVHDAARISKLPGTWVRKGQNSAERPHRVAQVIDVPYEQRIVTKDMLEALVEDLGERAAIEDETKPQSTSGNPSKFTAKAKGQSVPTTPLPQSVIHRFFGASVGGSGLFLTDANGTLIALMLLDVFKVQCWRNLVHRQAAGELVTV
jgi:uncharacterized protein YeaC (DUF1315 family)